MDVFLYVQLKLFLDTLRTDTYIIIITSIINSIFYYIILYFFQPILKSHLTQYFNFISITTNYNLKIINLNIIHIISLHIPNSYFIKVNR